MADYQGNLTGAQIDALPGRVSSLEGKVDATRTTLASIPAALADNTIYTISDAVSGDVTIPAPASSEGGVVLIFTAGAVDSLAFEGAPKWMSEVAGTLTSGSQYMLTILDGIYSLVELLTA